MAVASSGWAEGSQAFLAAVMLARTRLRRSFENGRALRQKARLA